MHRAVIRGDLAEVAVDAQTLTRYEGPPGMPERATTYVTAIRQAATTAAAAPTAVAAATASALMLSACGQCHRLVGARPSIAVRGSPELGGLVGHMLAHQRAADQIFQGLLLPSDALWREGTRAFASQPLHSMDLPVGGLERRKLSRTEEQIHRIATDAAQANEPRARANYYGQLLAGCADCHSQSAKWGPGKGR
jgi:cytochrome c553